MFRRWPFFQRMLSWTKPFSPADRRSREYERYDWNSLLAEEEELRGIQADHMDGTSYFPSRPEMEENLTAFVESTGIRVRYGCRWESTRREGTDFVLVTSDGEYRAPVLVFAVGVAEPWRPSTPGLDQVPHYADLSDAGSYAGKDVLIVGKKNSGFEVANGLLQWARSITLVSPSPATTSVQTRSLVGVRARYVQPIEDNALGGGVWVVNASIDAVEKGPKGYRVRTHFSDGSAQQDFNADVVIAATGFQTPLQDLTDLGVTTFGQSGLPAQTTFWESPTAPGIYFAGTITQGAAGLKKHGLPSNSGAVHGHRYNARVLARHLATRYFDVAVAPIPLKAADVRDRLLDELSGGHGYGADIFHQRSYLARVISIDSTRGIYDEGVQPLQHFYDDPGPDAVAATLEANPAGEIYPAIYVRRNGVIEHGGESLDPDLMLDFRGPDQQKQLAECLAPLLGSEAG
jgi:thioredoxin reductase